MLKKNSQFFESLLFITDLVVLALSWFAAYHIRFMIGLISTPKGVPDFAIYALLLIPMFAIWAFAFKAFGLYRPKRMSTHLSEVVDIAKACVCSVLVLITLTYFFRQYEFSRLAFLFFTIINTVALSVERIIFREILQYMRKRGYNQRHALIVGTGKNAEDFITGIDTRPEVGIKIKGILSVDESQVGNSVNGLKVIGTYKDIKEIIAANKIESVFIALSWDEHVHLVDVLAGMDDEIVDINVIPDIYEFATLRGGVEEFCGLPLIKLQGSPLHGWNVVIKRGADILFSGLFITLSSPLMLLIALLIKITSPGPVLYRQERMGIGGDTFNMLKFRSMGVDAELESGAVWASKSDTRKTLVGSLLRKTSMDELPQLLNVLKGEMSLVGPRPERPVFIQNFRKDIPMYMLRHQVKAGITGWAQVNGWRGNTNIKKRIEHDIYYIENWSLLLDLKIMLLTLWTGLIHKNAY